MVELFVVLLLVTAIVPAFMPTRLAFRRSIALFLVSALSVIFASIGARELVGFKFGGPEMLILGGLLSLIVLTISVVVRMTLLRRNKPPTR